MEQCCRVELDEFHILHRSFGAVDHRYAVAGSYRRIGRRCVDLTDASGCHNRYLSKEGVHLARLRIEHIGAVAGDVGRAACYYLAQMMLRDDFYGKPILHNVDVRMTLDGAYQAFLNLRSRVVGVVEYAKFRVSTFAVQVEIAVLFLVEVYAPVDELSYLRRRFAHYLFYRRAVA